MEKITGKNNELIKDIKRLLSSSKKRRAEGLFVLEGARLVFDVLNSFYKVKYFLITSSCYEKNRDKADELCKLAGHSYMISDDIADKLSETQNSQGVFAVCEIPEADEISLDKNSKVIVLDNVQDPGNLGAIVRTAEALGIDAVVSCGGCDMYNPKALRASMGSMLRISLTQQDNIVNVLEKMKSIGLNIYGTSPSSDAVPITDIDFSNGAVCIIGNEANGISQEAVELCDSLITIRMLGRAESLNASVAASITMWEMLR